mmetsp:Transcript_32920/g.74521  ORF Transcript_32920/g.74521 Transcript_32920/m.74521 type:complete len:146 (-) Transcript_32920:2543-2980(-)
MLTSFQTTAIPTVRKMILRLYRAQNQREEMLEMTWITNRLVQMLVPAEEMEVRVAPTVQLKRQRETVVQHLKQIDDSSENSVPIQHGTDRAFSGLQRLLDREDRPLRTEGADHSGIESETENDESYEIDIRADWQQREQAQMINA